jgi:hypothetical protein
MKRTTAVLGLVIAVAASACGSDASPDAGLTSTTPRIMSITLDDVHRRMLAAIDGDGQVFYTRIDYSVDIGGKHVGAIRGTQEIWIDVESGAARMEADVGQGESRRHEIRIINGDTTYLIAGNPGRPNRPQTCHGSSSGLLSTLLSCRGVLEESTTHVEVGAEYDGRPAIILLTEGTTRDSDGKYPFTQHLYIDEQTWLPLGVDTDSTWFTGDAAHTTERFNSEFLARDSLPADFFDAVANGWIESDEEAAFREAVLNGPDVDITMYWLGSSLDPDGPLPPLRLDRGHTTDYGGSPYSGVVDYALAEIGGRRILGFQLYSVTAWHAAGLAGSGYWWNSPDAQVEIVPLNNGEARIYATRGNVSHEDYMAHVYFDDTIIMIGHFVEDSPYDNPEGMRAIVLALRPFE